MLGAAACSHARCMPHGSLTLCNNTALTATRVLTGPLQLQRCQPTTTCSAPAATTAPPSVPPPGLPSQPAAQAISPQRPAVTMLQHRCDRHLTQALATATFAPPAAAASATHRTGPTQHPVTPGTPVTPQTMLVTVTLTLLEV
jgi:hypothetical protein